MKILLANPALSKEEQKNPVISKLFSNAMPLGICYLAAVLEREQIGVDIIDGAAENITQQDILDRFRKGNFDILGITSTTVSFHRAIELAQMAKQQWGNSVPILLGGPHISAVPLHAMEEKAFDIGVYGEAEETIIELLNTMNNKGDLSQVKGIYYREGDDLKFTGYRPLIQDLDTIPFPARHYLNPKLYTSLPTDVRRLPKFSILANRGCPFKCIFCDSAVVGKKYRVASPRYMVDEMEHVVREYGAKEIFFVGTTFTVSREKTEEFLDELESRNLDLYWTCSTRVDVVDRQLLRRMRRAGCWAVRFGVESGNEEVLKFIRKNIALTQVKRVMKICEEEDIHSKAFFMVGHLPDTPESIRDSINFAKHLAVKDITVQINTPLPNTDQYDLAHQYGTFNDKDFTKFSFFDPVFVPKGMTEKQLVQYQRQFYHEFYWNPTRLIQQAKKVMNINTFIKYMKSLDLILYLTMNQG